LVGWLVGRLVGWLVGRLVGWCLAPALAIFRLYRGVNNFMLA
jgi:hypothetical protein